MADVNREAFSRRVARLDKTPKDGARVRKRIGKDGLVETTYVKKRGLVPYRTIGLSVIILIVTKGFILAEVGQPTYDQNIEQMKSGSVVAIAAAFLLDDDRATVAVANTIARIRAKY